MATADHDRSVEAQARRYLRLFPAWVRATRGEEAVSLVLDLLPPGSTRLPAGARVDLVRAGLQQRRREVPPPSVWWSTHLGGTTRSPGSAVDERWHPWLLHLARPRFWLVRYALRLWLLVMIPVAAVKLAAFGRPDALGVVSGTLVIPFFALFIGQDWRRRVLDRNGYDLDLTPQDPERRRVLEVPSTLPNAPMGPLSMVGAALVVASSVVAAALVAWWPADGLTGRALVRAGAVGVGCSLVVAVVGALWVRKGIAPRVQAADLQRPPAPIDGRGRGSWQLVVFVLGIPVLVMIGGGGAVSTAVTVPLAVSASMTLVWGVRRVERVVGRPLGIWDLFPSVGPRSEQTGAARPASWSRPPPPSWRPPSPGSPTPS